MVEDAVGWGKFLAFIYLFLGIAYFWFVTVGESDFKQMLRECDHFTSTLLSMMVIALWPWVIIRAVREYYKSDQ